MCDKASKFFHFLCEQNQGSNFVKGSRSKFQRLYEKSKVYMKFKEVWRKFNNLNKCLKSKNFKKGWSLKVSKKDQGLKKV
jgi:hypothetical protein